MSKKTIWDRPEVATALQQLRDALEKTLRKKERESLGTAFRASAPGLTCW